LNQAKDNVILFPHMWSGTSKSMEIFIGKDRPLNPDKYFVILPGQFANGFSSSPSNTPPPFNGGAFPNVTIGDDVRAQHRLVTEHFGIRRLELVLGWSMGAEQTYEWAVRFPTWSNARCHLPALPRRHHTTTSSCGPMRTHSNRTPPGTMVSTNTKAMFMSAFDAMPRSGR
jgi:homoserine acetyltransferase